MDILSILFGSEERVKIIRLFLFNPEQAYDIGSICERSKSKEKNVKREIAVFFKAGLIKRKVFFVNKSVKRGTKIIEKKKKVHGYILNSDFPYLVALKQLLISTKTLDGSELIKKVSKAGKIKLLIVAGIFIQNPDSRADIFVVGDKVNRRVLDRVIKNLESEIGKELVYAYFDTADYHYRLGMYDKLVRDVIDYPHKVLLDRISLKKATL